MTITVGELIKQLSKLPPDLELMALELDEADAQFCNIVGVEQVDELKPEGWVLNIAVNHGM